ncbi:type VI immunity family protein, partial [Pseudomonas sp. SDO5511_1_S431]
MEPEFNLAEELCRPPHLLEIPGNLLMKGGREDYIGAVLCLRGTLYFKEAQTSLVREALSRCFDEFKRCAEPNLAWLWREEPPQGKPLTTYAETKPLREMMGAMDEDDHLSFCYTSGERSRDASAWLFDVFGKRGWEAKMGDDLSVLEFSVPLLYQEQYPLKFGSSRNPGKDRNKNADLM